MEQEDDIDFEEFDYDELMKEEDDIEKEKEKWKRYQEYVEREKKRGEIRRAEFEDRRRRDNTALMHEMTRQIRKTRPEASDLLDQLWDENDPAKINQLKEKILDIAPPELQNYLKKIFSII